MLEGKGYKCNDMVVPFVAAFIDNAIGCAEQAPLTTVHTAFFNLFCCLMLDKAAAVDSSRYRSEI